MKDDPSIVKLSYPSYCDFISIMSTTLDVINGSCLTLLGYFDGKYRQHKDKLPGKVPPRKTEKGTRKNRKSTTRK